MNGKGELKHIGLSSLQWKISFQHPSLECISLQISPSTGERVYTSIYLWRKSRPHSMEMRCYSYWCCIQSIANQHRWTVRMHNIVPLFPSLEINRFMKRFALFLSSSFVSMDRKHLWYFLFQKKVSSMISGLCLG